MTSMRLLSVTALLLFSLAVAHGQSDSGRSGGRRANRQADPDQFVQRIMSSDADEDGKLSREELAGGRFLEVFDQADANGDGQLEPSEIVLYLRTSGDGVKGGTAREAKPADAAPSEKAFMEEMERSGRALMSLRRTSFKAKTFDRDMKMLLELESSLTAARRHVSAVPMSLAAKAMFGSDQKAYRRAFQRHMVASLIETLQVEMAVLEGDAARAKAGVAALVKSRNESHDLF